MKKLTPFVVAAALVFVPAALADDTTPAPSSADPVAALQQDIQTLQTDKQTAHDTLIADAQKLQADAVALKGQTRKQAKPTVNQDIRQLVSDYQHARELFRRDHRQIERDFRAARHAKVAKTDRQALRDILKQLRTVLQQERTEVRDAVKAARDAVKELRASFPNKQQGEQQTAPANGMSDQDLAPSVEVPAGP